jgi:hypothetical protein
MTLKLSADVQVIISELANIIKRDSEILKRLEFRLAGPLIATVSESSISKHRKEAPSRSDSHGKNWNRLMNQMHAATGEYQVEVLELN